MNQPKVSIVVPVYRVEQYIAECVQSVIEQDYPALELLLVDDCGGDRSADIAEQTLTAAGREGLAWRILRHDHNRGVSAARNTAFHAATGDYILCLDSDDRLLPGCVSRLVERAEETRAEVTMCDHVSDDGRVGIGGRTQAPVPLIETNSDCIRAFRELWFSLGPWCKLVRTDFLRRHELYFCEGIINEDAPWLFQLSLAAKRMAFINEPLYFYRYNAQSIMSASKRKMVVDSNEVALQMFLDSIVARPDLYDSRDVWLIFMRQIDIFYKLVRRHRSFAEYCRRLRRLSALRYPSPWFTAKDVPTTYHIWRAMQRVPALLAAPLTWLMLAVQDRRS